MAMTIGFLGGKKLAELPDIARFAAEQAVPHLEFDYWGDFKEINDDVIAQMKRILGQHHVNVAAYGLWGFNHMSPDPQERAANHALLERGIEYAKRLGAKVLVTGSGSLPGKGLDENVQEFCRVWPPLLKKIEAAGMRAAFYAVHGATFFNDLQAYEAVWKHLPNVGIKYDPANWHIARRNYLDVVRLHGDKIAHVHIKEHVYDGEELVAQPPAGMGDIHWGKVMCFLHEHKYDGCLSIEPHGPLWGRGEMRKKMVVLSNRYISQFLA
jgi:sugar phosphate isomerase/epimerase